jgi:hypothetical protein
MAGEYLKGAGPKNGRPYDFHLNEAIDKIFFLLEENPEAIKELKTITHVCAYLGISRETWYSHIRKAKDNKKLLDAVNLLKTLQEKWWVEFGISGKAPSRPWEVCMKNVMGWKDRVEAQIEGTGISINLNYKKDE